MSSNVQLQIVTFRYFLTMSIIQLDLGETNNEMSIMNELWNLRFKYKNNEKREM